MTRWTTAASLVTVGLLASCGGGEPEDTQAPTEVVDDTPLARCDYRNPFSSEAECKEYRGDDWTAETAQFDCETNLAGGAGTYTPDASCDLAVVLGTCWVETEPGMEYLLHVGGDQADQCSGAELACTAFVSGTYTPQGVCVAGTEEDGHTVFIWPYESCEEPIEGEDPGDGPDGSVCVWNSIDGCVEEGRDFRDYGSCDVVFTNRPYYPVDPYGSAAADDPRLSDADYLTELEWVTEQTKSCGCVCCHSAAAPDGAAIWGVDGEVLWPDQMSDTAIGMFAGYVDSSALGAYDAEDNNGFDRFLSAMPSTNPSRMVAFWQAEMDRRGLTAADMSDEPPVGAGLLEQMEAPLDDCAGLDAVAADGTITWEANFDLRYLYVLEEGSLNPGVPPNFDTPDGVIWRIDIPYDGVPMASGVPYGSLPETAIQVVPESGPAPELIPGERYHLYGLYDVALPVTRCVFTMPEAEEAASGGCSHTPRSALAWLTLPLLLAVRRRR